MDAILIQQQDPIKYPKWLHDSAVKQAERSVYIHMAKPNARRLLAAGVSNHQEWLDEITNEKTYNSIALFLLKAGLFTEQMYGSIA